MLTVELGRDGCDPRYRELAHGVPNELLLLRQVEFQADATSLSASSQISRTP